MANKPKQTKRTKKSILTKAQRKDYEVLHKRFRISEKAYLQYWQSIRKARKKLRDAFRRGHIIAGRPFSLKVDRIKTRKEFNARVREINAVLDKGYLKKAERLYKNKLISNIKNYLGLKDNDIVLEKLKSMTNKEFFKFIDNNSDIQIISFYAKGDEGSEILEVINVEYDSFYQRLFEETISLPR